MAEQDFDWKLHDDAFREALRDMDEKEREHQEAVEQRDVDRFRDRAGFGEKS